MESYIGKYSGLIRGFVQKGYRPVFFENASGADGELIIRHDVDFDCQLAYEMSLIEDELGVRSTYFFLVRSNSYNPFSQKNAEYIRSIYERGHRVSIHFDPTLYQDLEKGFQKERALFESFFRIPITTVSVHRPNDFLKNCNAPICGIEHTYQDKFFRDIKYISDSQGSFRFGHPFETSEWHAMKSIHLLIHPIWWLFPDTKNNLDLLDRFFASRTEDFQEHIADNCIPYRERIAP